MSLVKIVRFDFLEGVTMTERLCRNCKWFDQLPEKGYGTCKRHPPDIDGEHPYTDDENFCGEWSDSSITPEQAERRELTRQFAVAIMSTEYGGNLEPDRVWSAAKSFAAAEPQIQREDEQ
jgi:hypothetical protein